VAWRVVSDLETTVGAQPDLEFHRLDGGQRLLDLLDGRGSLIVIDALANADSPGSVVELFWHDERLANLRPGSTHDLGPAAALRLADALGLLPPNVIVFGISVTDFVPSQSLSQSAAQAACKLVERLRDELGSPAVAQ
jgi:hydrogenase maturation protease